MLIRQPPPFDAAGQTRRKPTGKRIAVIPHSDSELSLKGMRILVVDDDRNTRELLGEILSLYDADVQTAESVVVALTLYQTWRPALVVSDLGMPGQDGYDLIRSIRALPGGATTKAIAVTGYSKDEDRNAALAAGFDMFLSKPVDLDKLINLLGTIDRS